MMQPMSDAAPVPASLDQITAAWLTTTLQEWGVIGQQSRIFGVHSERLAARAGVNGQTFRLRLKYAGPAGPETVIAKLPAEQPAARGVAAFQHWYEREARFYLELAPDSPLRVPEPFFAAAEGDRILLLLEDLGRLRQVDQLSGCTLAEAEAAVDGIAEMHARWWGDEVLSDHPWLPLTTVGLHHAAPVHNAFRRAWGAIRAGVDAGAHDRLDRAVEAYPALLERISAGPLTVLHGDYRLDNLFFDGSEGQPGVVAFDWQFACRGRGPYDLAYFIGLNLTPALRRQHEEALILRYYERLREAGVSGYPLDACHRDYATSLLLSFAVFAIGAAGPPSDDRMREVHEVGLDRLASAIVERDAGIYGL